MLQREELKRRKEDARMEAAHRRDEEREEAEAAAVEEQRQRQAELKAKEEAEYDQWKGDFAVDDAGHLSPPASPSSSSSPSSSLAAFLSFIRTRKVVQLDEVALHFHLRTSDVLQRIQQLQAQGLLSGVADERGKWIEVEEAEMERLQGWLVDKGRVTVHDLVVECNRLIDVTERQRHDDDQQPFTLDDDDGEEEGG